MCQARGPRGSCRHREGKGQQSYSSRNAARTPSLPLCLGGTAIAPESLQQLSLVGLTPPASLSNTLLVEGDDGVFILQRFLNLTVAICVAVTSPGLSHQKKSSSNTFLLHCSLFLFSQHKKATLLARAGEIDLIWFCFD